MGSGGAGSKAKAKAKSASSASKPQSLGDFSDDVLRAARQHGPSHFAVGHTRRGTGPEMTGKIFIHEAYRAWKRGPGRNSSMTLDAFKRRLVQANQAGHVRLGRADLIESMRASSVRLSFTPHTILYPNQSTRSSRGYNGPEYNFLRIE
jgi:hypothetical protein